MPTLDPLAPVPALPSRRVLVVEDDPVVSRLIAEVLAEVGYVVNTAHDGAEALASLTEARPDVVVLDLEMPGLDGRAFLTRCRQDPRHRHLPVVVLSGAATAREDAQRLGAQAYMGKPFVIDRLRDIVGALPYTPDAVGLVRQCAWCYAVLDRDDVYSLQPRIRLQGVTHGVCPVCKGQLYAEIEAP